MNTWNWDIRDHLYVFKNSSLDVLIKLWLHCNANLRTWVSYKTIQDGTGLTQPTVTDAVRHLEAIGAVMRIPGAFRADEERTLPSRQTIYQLTGWVFWEGQALAYLHFGNPETQATIVGRMIAMHDYVSTKSKDDAKSKQSLALKANFLIVKDFLPKGSTVLSVGSTPSPSASPDDEKKTKPRKRTIRDNYFDALRAHQEIGRKAGMFIPTDALVAKQVTPLMDAGITPSMIEDLYKHAATAAKQGSWKRWTVNVLASLSVDFLESRKPPTPQFKLKEQAAPAPTAAEQDEVGDIIEKGRDKLHGNN